MLRKILASSLCMISLLAYLGPVAGPMLGQQILAIEPPTMEGRTYIGSQAVEAMGDIFTENMGQVENDDILFYSSGGSVAFTRDSVLIYTEQTQGGIDDTNVSGNVLAFSFAGANDIRPEGIDPAPWRTNFIRGNAPSSWRTGVANYRGVMFPNIWDGIDLVYRMESGSVKYDFMVHPGADWHQIKVHVCGHESLSVGGNSELRIGTGLGPGTEVLDSGLVAYYADNITQTIPARFGLIDDDTYTFMLGVSDPAREIIIDPLIYSTFLGGANLDYGNDVAVGIDGCAYVAGQTDSPDFITTPGSYDRTYAGYTYDIFVAKMGLNGDSLVYSTLIGDEGLDCAKAIAVDASGNAYITGYTNSDNFPTTAGAMDRSYNGDTYDSFVAKLGPMGDSLIASTFLGSDRVEYGNGIAVDGDGYVYVTGETWSLSPQLSSNSFPATPGAFRWGGGTSDVFVTKLNQGLTAPVYSTFFGTAEYETSNAIAVDGNGYAYITGYTRSDQYPTTTSAFDRSYGGSLDAFVTKITPTGSSLAYSTYLGGSSGEVGYDIAVGQWGHAYVTGYTQSPEFPTTEWAFDKTHNGWHDAFVTILSKFGDNLAYSSFLGGSESDDGISIAVDGAGCAIVAGNTVSGDFPVTGRAIDPTYNGNSDAFVVKFPLSGDSLQYSSYLGGTGLDHAAGVGVSPTGFTYVVGDTASLDYPNTTKAFDMTFNGGSDAFVTKLDLDPPRPDAGLNQRVNEDEPVLFDAGLSRDNQAIANYTWTFNDSFANITLNGDKPAYVFTNPGIYTITLNVSDETGNWATDTMELTVLDTTHPIAVAGPDQSVIEDTIVHFNGSGSTDNVGVVNHTWTFVHANKNVALYGSQASFNFTEPGIYNVLLTARDAAGNPGTDGLVVSVKDITGPTANAGDDMRVYSNTVARFDGTASSDNVAIVNYTWSFNDGRGDITLHLVQPTHLFDIIGIYTVTLDVADAAGYHDTDTMIVTVLETEKPVAEAGPDLGTEEGLPTKLDGTASTDNVGVTDWLWSFNDGLNNVSIAGPEPVWTFPRAGSFTITLNASDAAGNWDTDTMSVTVADTTPPTVMAGSNQAVMPGRIVFLDSEGTHDNSGIANLTWTFDYNGTAVALYGPAPTFIFNVPGTYEITLNATDGAGNSGIGMMTVTVLPGPVVSQEIQADNTASVMVAASFAIALAGVLILLLRRRRWARR